MKVYGIIKMDVNGNGKTLFGYNPNEGAMRMPCWVNDSIIIHIRYSQQFYSSEIFSMDSSGENIIRLTFNDENDYYPKYSDNKIAFTSQANDEFKINIWTMNSNGTNLNKLTDNQAYGCSWSPDGKYIVYTDARAENGRLWIMNMDGSNKRQLTFKNQF
jgi:Tol biopolymer transport system component